jgi:RimJ/RimL family protein N-acetyltransferase
MSEAVRGALEWYFTATNADVLASGVFHFNKPSLAIQKKLGFTETGLSSRLCLARGEEVRHIDTELTRAVWAEQRAA